MGFVKSIFGGGNNGQMAAITAAQQRQQAELDQQKRNTDAKESALLRLFSGGAGRSLASAPLATSLGG